MNLKVHPYKQYGKTESHKTSKESVIKNIDGLLIDLDGVVYISNKAIPGAAEAITRLKSKNIPLRFVTNTTTMSQDSLHKKMVAMGLPIEKHEIISAVQVAVLFLRDPVAHSLLWDQLILINFPTISVLFPPQSH